MTGYSLYNALWGRALAQLRAQPTPQHAATACPVATIMQLHLSWINGLSTCEVGRGHATPHMPVETAKYWNSLKVDADCTAAFATRPRICFFSNHQHIAISTGICGVACPLPLHGSISPWLDSSYEDSALASSLLAGSLQAPCVVVFPGCVPFLVPAQLSHAYTALYVHRQGPVHEQWSSSVYACDDDVQ